MTRHSPRTLSALLLLALYAAVTLAFSCDGGCSGHGACDGDTGRCQCFPGYVGVLCASKQCPKAAAWVDRAWAVDTAHASAECSNMGVCNRETGVCVCEAGFEGTACERLACPNACSGAGRCVSMREAAALQDGRGLLVSTTYALWDADKLRGCVCDPGFTGIDCSRRECPKGDDPLTTGQADEVQHLDCQCDGCTGTFALGFRGRVTANLAPTADVATLETALEALTTIYGVTVTLSGSGSTICDADGATSSITFTHNPGDLPELQVLSQLSGGTTATVSVASGGASGGFDGVGASVDGTREEVSCSNHGTCDVATGRCVCASGFVGSNGAGAIGTRGDCGVEVTAVTSCPSTSSNGVCDGKGSCSGSPEYRCICDSGYTGYDCKDRMCPTGAAWFDGASAADTAHADAQCSNKGLCDVSTGVCACVAPFTGSACHLMRCPTGTATTTGATCSGRGTCKSMTQLAAEATDALGVSLGVTYGATPNTASVWDASKIQGCDCDARDYFGPYENAFGDFAEAHDCSVRGCPRGEDPFESGKVNEQQTLSCTADGGVFTLTFRQEQTSVLAFDATAAEIKAALESLSTVRYASVSFDSGVAVCGASVVTTTVEFTFMQGDLPLLTADTSALTLAAGSASLTVAELVKGDKANVECSARGTCNRATGVCTCFDYFLSSDGDGNLGRRGDCGYKAPYPAVALA